MKIITLSIEKGGVLKTTTCVNIAYALALRGKKVGIIDLDIQRHAGLNLDPQGGITIEEALKKGSIELKDFGTTANPNLYILPNNGDINLKFFNNYPTLEQPYLLMEALKNLEGLDYLFIDTPPSIEIQTINALLSSDYVLAPCTLEIFSFTGLKTLVIELKKLRKFNPRLELIGVLPTKVDQRFSSNTSQLTLIKDILGDESKIFKSYIRQNVTISRGQEQAKTVFENKDIKGIEDFEKIADELEERIKLKTN